MAVFRGAGVRGAPVFYSCTGSWVVGEFTTRHDWQDKTRLRHESATSTAVRISDDRRAQSLNYGRRMLRTAGRPCAEQLWTMLPSTGKMEAPTQPRRVLASEREIHVRHLPPPDTRWSPIFRTSSDLTKFFIGVSRVRRNFVVSSQLKNSQDLHKIFVQGYVNFRNLSLPKNDHCWYAVDFVVVLLF